MTIRANQEIYINMIMLEGLERSSSKYNFRCPFCGDSKTDKSKKRGYLYLDKKNKDKYKFKCFNCGLSLSFNDFLQQVDVQVYKKYIFETLGQKRINSYKNKNNPEIEHKIANSEVKKLIDTLIRKQIITNVKKIDNINVMKYLYNRKIPKKKLNKFFYIDNFFDDLYVPMKKLLKEIKNENYTRHHFDNDPRVFWFIKNRKNEIIGIQGRSLNKNTKIRYLTVKITNDPMIGNLEQIRLTDNVYITEGFIDSLFLDNCVSLNGSSFFATIEQLKELNVKNMIIVFDNEPQNEEIRAIVEKVIRVSMNNKLNKIGVCLLPKYLRDHGKDLNDYILNVKDLDKSKLINIINKNTFYGINAKIKFRRW